MNGATVFARRPPTHKSSHCLSMAGMLYIGCIRSAEQAKPQVGRMGDDGGVEVSRYCEVAPSVQPSKLEDPAVGNWPSGYLPSARYDCNCRVLGCLLRYFPC